MAYSVVIRTNVLTDGSRTFDVLLPEEINPVDKEAATALASEITEAIERWSGSPCSVSLRF